MVVRGPKPATVLHSRKVRIDCAASDPFTTHEVLAGMHGTPLRGKRVVVQRYGETNRELQAELESEGADVIEIVTYRWGLPEDTAPLLRLIDALGRDEIDLVAFTSASQVSNLFTVAQCDGKEASLKQSHVRRFNRPRMQRRAPQAHREGRYRSKTAEARAVD